MIVHSIIKIMKVVGLTGGIGSGKTIVSNVFIKLGIQVYNSDIQAKILMNTDMQIINQLKDHFGKDVYLKDRTLNKNKLAEYIFNDKSKLQIVNNIVHPVVSNHFKNWLQNQSSKYVIKETAILFESETYKDTNIIITVFAPESLRIKRLLKRDNTTVNDIRSRIKNQISEEEKMNRSDYIIYNYEEQLVLPQIIQIHKSIIRNHIS